MSKAPECAESAIEPQEVTTETSTMNEPRNSAETTAARRRGSLPATDTGAAGAAARDPPRIPNLVHGSSSGCSPLLQDSELQTDPTPLKNRPC